MGLTKLELFQQFRPCAIIRSSDDGQSNWQYFPLPWAIKIVEVCIENDVAVFHMEGADFGPPYTEIVPRLDLIYGSLKFHKDTTWEQERDTRNGDALRLLHDQNPDDPLLFQFFLMAQEDFDNWTS